MAGYAIDELIGVYVLKRFGGKPPKYQKDVRSKVIRLAYYFGRARDVNSLNPPDMQGFIDWMRTERRKCRGAVEVAEPLSPFTINSCVRALRAMFNWAVRQGLMVESPLDGVKTPRTPQKVPAAVEQVDVEYLLGALKPEVPWLYARNVALIYCLRDTGARVGGLCGASLTDLELDRQQLTVTEKGEKARAVYLSAVTIEKLRAYLKLRREFWGRRCSDALFIGRDGGGLAYAGVYQVLRAAASRVHLNGRFNPHSFRHAFARDMLRNGADLTQVSQLMGHAGIQVTADYYARWADAELRQAHKKSTPAHQMPGGDE